MSPRKMLKFLHFLIFCVCNLLNVTVTAAFETTSFIRFKRDTSRNKTIVPIDQYWQDKSATSCGITAFAKHPEIRSFIFNVKTKQCAPVLRISATRRLPTQDEFVYISSACRSTEGFRLSFFNNTTACIGIFNETLNYTEATNACREKQSFLTSLKDTDKLEILRNEVSSTHRFMWIGLDDLVNEGKHIWSEDLTELKNPLKGQIFMPFEPNNANGDEDCVEFVSTARLLNDDNCSNRLPYACERTII